MEGLPVAGSPENKGRERQQDADESHAQELLGGDGCWRIGAAEAEDKRRRESYGDEGAIGTEQGFPGDGEGEGEGVGPSWTLVEAGGGPEREGQGDEGWRFRKGRGGVGGGEGTERRKPERGKPCARCEAGRGDAGGEVGQEKAAHQFEKDLQNGGREVVFHAEKLEADGEKNGVAG